MKIFFIDNQIFKSPQKKTGSFLEFYVKFVLQLFFV
jgi:hypothetical protein